VSPDLRAIAGVDRLIHEPARLMIVTLLYAMEEADFLYLLTSTGLTRGNLSAHLARLEEGGYVMVQKTFRGRIPQTVLVLSPNGRRAYEVYREDLKRIIKTMNG
jgi:DNA-binding MarR family transcriptional regulator